MTPATKKTDDEQVAVATPEGDTTTALPSVEDAAVTVTTNAETYATSDAADPNVGWTVQSDAHFEEVAVKSEGEVPKEALPTKEGLKEAGVRDPGTYLQGVAKAK